MWERFCYYGMRALLLLYLVKSLAMGDNKGFAVYGAYTALVYVMPVIGGRIADQSARFSVGRPASVRHNDGHW
jgi:POT family proton-dependent oligopeptide transporter